MEDYRMTTEPTDARRAAVDSLTEQVNEMGRLVCDSGTAVGPTFAMPVAESGDCVVDWQQLIGRIIDEALVAEVMPLCVADNRARLTSLATAVEKGDIENVRSYAHGIKGSTANLGAKHLSELACILERRASQGDLSQAGELFEKVRAEFDRFESFVSQANWIEIAKKNSE
jgi:HPt (histidine-containing phosphotransfer) domain-containing protein